MPSRVPAAGQDGSSRKPPMFLRVRSSQLFIIATVSLSVFADIFLYAVIVPVIPYALSERAGIPEEDRQYWVSVLLAVYGAALLIAAPICGYISDKFKSRLWPFVIGVVLLAGATLCLCLGTNIKILILGRVLQGVSAAVVWTIGLALLVDTVGRRRVGWAMGFVSTSMSCGLLIAPVLGGAVFSKGGYFQVYAMCFGLLGLDIVMRVLVIEKKTKRFWLGDDASRSNSTGMATPATLRSGGVARHTTNIDALAVAPSDDEESQTTWQRIAAKLPPVVTLLASLRILVALFGTLVQAIMLTSFDSTIPLYVQDIWGWGSLNAGLLFLPLVFPTFGASYFGIWADKIGPRYFIAGGFLCACPSIILLRLITENSLKDKIGMCFLLFFTGLSYALSFAPLMAEITYAVASKEQPTESRPAMYFGKYGAYAQAYGLFNVFFAGGCLIGPIWGGMIRDAAGWGTMTLALGLLSGVTAIPSFIWNGGSIFNKHKRVWQREIPAGPQRPSQPVDLETNSSALALEESPVTEFMEDPAPDHDDKTTEDGQENDSDPNLSLPIGIGLLLADEKESESTRLNEVR